MDRSLVWTVLACLACLTQWPDAARAEAPPFDEDTTALLEQIEQQNYENELLRRQLAEAQGATLIDDRHALSGTATPIDFAAPGEASATAAPNMDAILKRLDALEKSAAKPVADAKEKKPDDGWIDLSTEKWTVKLAGHVQMDYINWLDADPSIPNTQDYFEFRRLRLVADGTGYGVLDFRLQMTLEPEAVGASPAGQVVSPDVKDAYLSMNAIPHVGRWRIGNFFVPFGLEQVTNDTFNVFLERSIPTQGIFTADREVGMAIYNCTEDQNVTWAFGTFFDSISEGLKERIDDNQGYRASGRLTWLPWYDEPSNGRYLVHTGVGVLHTGDQDDRVRFRARPQIHEGPQIIDSGVIDADDYTTFNVELATVLGPFSIQSELYGSQVYRTNADTVFLTGAYIHASYFLTGESRVYERFGQHGAQFGRNVPISNFFVVPGCCGPGAWELKARMSHLNLDEVDRGQYNDVTVGFNWYWNERVRLMFDWIHPVTTQDAVFGDTTSDIIASRFDFNW